MSFFDIGDEMISIRKYNDNDIEEMAQIWNEVVNDAVAFPQIEPLGDDAKDFSHPKATAVLPKMTRRGR